MAGVVNETESVLDKIVLDPLEDGLDKLGMMQGEYAPLKRTVFGTAVGSAVVWYTKPNIAFKNGKPRPWKVTEGTNDDATWTPWWVLGAFPGILLGIFI